MSSAPPIAPNPSRVGVAHQMATRIVFFLSGSTISAWAPLIPFAKNRLQVSDGRLGLLLLCAGVGSVITMPLAGVLAGRYGCRRMIMILGGFGCCMLPLLAIAQNTVELAAVLLAFGAACGALDATMNIHAVLVERESGRAMMSGFHGMWSVGGIAGAGTISVMISAGTTPLTASIIVSVTLLAILGAAYKSLLPTRSDSTGPAFVWPHGKVLLLGCFCFVLFLAEGAVLDWSAVFLATVRKVTAAHAGFAFVAFSTAMTVCRLIGDPIVRTVGSARVVLFGSLLAAAGFLVAISLPSPAMAIVGFGLVGVGASNVVPIMFSAAGRQSSMPANLAIPAMTTLAYAGNLAGPALVGFLANQFGLSIGLALIAAMLVVVAIVSTRTRL
jgi:predicted MFS family arabinose efflux permease